MRNWSQSSVSHFHSDGIAYSSVVGRMLVALLVASLRLYRLLLSPMLGENCRFEPSCSRFLEEALRRYGVCRGTWMGLRRLASCHPWGGGGGFDPVP
jgi:putative membrane protein insertion efficiency factor